MTLHVLDVVRVVPTKDSDSVSDSANSFAIPLTFFDLPWLLFQPTKRVFFYKHTNTTRDLFHASILPNLKLSLSIVLHNYLPLTGRITWDPNDSKPSIIVSQNEYVLVTIAETDADFSHLSSYTQRPISQLHTLLPELPVSDDSASAFSAKITLFPNHGFCIGIATHHAVMDGKSLSMFIKAWAQICKQQFHNNNFPLPENLIPFYDRSLVKDFTKIDVDMIEIVRSLQNDKSNQKSLKPIPTRELGDDIVHSTLVLSRENIERLRERVKKESPCGDRLRLSTFVITYAYAWTCLVKARGGSKDRTVGFLFVGDFRERLNPPLPVTYFGNCMFPVGSYNRKASEFSEEKGFVTAVEILSELVERLNSKKVETIVKEFADGCNHSITSSQFGTVAGSTRLGLYESDFGWGKPVKVDVVSIDQGEAISMAESRVELGGVEIGMCLKKTEMDILLTLFGNGLNV